MPKDSGQEYWIRESKKDVELEAVYDVDKELGRLGKRRTIIKRSHLSIIAWPGWHIM